MKKHHSDMYREPKSDPKPVKQEKKKPVPIRKASKTRQHQLKVYNLLRPIFLEEHPNCRICGAKATDIHHKIGRAGKWLLVMFYWMAVCRQCHNKITKHSAWAYEMGYSELRSNK